MLLFCSSKKIKFSLQDKEVLLRKTYLFLFRALKAAPETAGRSRKFWGLRPQNPLAIGHPKGSEFTPLNNNFFA